MLRRGMFCERMVVAIERFGWLQFVAYMFSDQKYRADWKYCVLWEWRTKTHKREEAYP